MGWSQSAALRAASGELLQGRQRVAPIAPDAAFRHVPPPSRSGSAAAAAAATATGTAVLPSRHDSPADSRRPETARSAETKGGKAEVWGASNETSGQPCTADVAALAVATARDAAAGRTNGSSNTAAGSLNSAAAGEPAGIGSFSAGSSEPQPLAPVWLYSLIGADFPGVSRLIRHADSICVLQYAYSTCVLQHAFSPCVTQHAYSQHTYQYERSVSACNDPNPRCLLSTITCA